MATAPPNCRQQDITPLPIVRTPSATLKQGTQIVPGECLPRTGKPAFQTPLSNSWSKMRERMSGLRGFPVTLDTREPIRMVVRNHGVSMPAFEQLCH